MIQAKSKIYVTVLLQLSVESKTIHGNKLDDKKKI